MITNVAEPVAEPARLRLYPNPVRDMAVLEMDFSGHKRLLVYDALGRLALSLDTAARQEEIGLKGLPSGLYFLQAFQEGRHFGTLRFLKQ